MNIEYVPIDEVKPYSKNAKKHPKAQIEKIAKSIEKFGWKQNLVIDSEGVLVVGHGRYEAAKLLGLKEVPCIITHADEEAIKADRLTDNKISEFSEWINEEMLHELDMIDIDIDFSELGFPQLQLDDIPTMDDFIEEEFGGDDGEEPAEEMSAEDKQARYEAFLREQEKQNAAKSA